MVVHLHLHTNTLTKWTVNAPSPMAYILWFFFSLKCVTLRQFVNRYSISLLFINTVTITWFRKWRCTAQYKKFKMLPIIGKLNVYLVKSENNGSLSNTVTEDCAIHLNISKNLRNNFDQYIIIYYRKVFSTTVQE